MWIHPPITNTPVIGVMFVNESKPSYFIFCTPHSNGRSVFFSSSHISFCSALSPACLQSVGHPADTILAPFTRVCWPQPAFVVCGLNAQQRGIPFGPVVSWNKPSATAPLSTWPEERGQAQIKWIHILYGPQQRIHSFCRPAVGKITSTHKTFLWVPLIAISISFWCLRKSFPSESRSVFSNSKCMWIFKEGQLSGFIFVPSFHLSWWPIFRVYTMGRHVGWLGWWVVVVWRCDDCLTSRKLQHHR